ncbi:hypothetical protein ADL15_48825 [Actinoplanes awajinensis subsp. mycoplanecinus]|uniref:Uncharacterized protein n=1 Tax=Actinoplanes awajinensis subsp. mycoplanecinus TaxID=135947 RepID=A0A101J922_9ACTN|nr:hypothetical protein ADL15_48825 [Actinoplanes awajinensis subsp. mycoplanecinus]
MFALLAGGALFAVRLLSAGAPAVSAPLAESFPVVLPPSPAASSEGPAPAGENAGTMPSRRSAATALPASAASGPATAPSKAGPITAYAACSTSTAVRFTATFSVTYAYRHVFIDTDANGATGYRVPDIIGSLGAEYMIENDLLYRSTGATWSWAEVAGVKPLLSHSGGTYRWRVKPSYGGVRVLFNGTDGNEEVSTPILPVTIC